MARAKKLTNIVTIKDVALKANVSISSVSRVINNKDGVSEDLETQIKQAVAELQYRPNTIARALKMKSTKSIGLIIPSIENPVFPPIVKVIEETANKYGFSTILCNSDGVLEKEAKYLELLLEKQVDGVILNAIGDYHERFELLKTTNTPILVLGRKIEGFQTSIVTINNFKGGYQAVEYLIKTGMKKIAFLFGELEAKSAINDRFEGYKLALHDYNIPYQEELVAHGNRSFEGGVYATNELISRSVIFDSIFASNDMMAIGCIEKLMDHGFNIPGDISVIGYDDISLSHMIKPQLSTVCAPYKEFGVGAVRAILKLIYSKKNNLDEKVFEPELVIRNSTRTL